MECKYQRFGEEIRDAFSAISQKPPKNVTVFALKGSIFRENVDSCDFDPPKSSINDSVEKVLALARFPLKSFPNVALDCRFLMPF